MARVFLDTNLYIDVMNYSAAKLTEYPAESSSVNHSSTQQAARYSGSRIKRAKEKWEHLRANLIFVSPLSTHILFYSYKLKVPNQEINDLQDQFGIIPLTETLVAKALKGPTTDFEDNVQLHSAAKAKADYFLTLDKKLLKLRFFGETEIVNTLQVQ